MKEFALKRRSRLRSKESRAVLAWMDDQWGVELKPGMDIESGSLEGKKAYIVEGKMIGIEQEGGLMLTLHGVMALKPQKKWVTVDMGAVKFLANGADVMSPGIVDADEGIGESDLVFVRDQNNLRPLCVGRALMSGKEMKGSNSGKAVRTLHYVGDPIWEVEL